MKRHGLTRREMLERGGIAVIGAGGLSLAGITGYAWPQDQAAAATIPTAPVIPNDNRGVLHFVSRPDLTPPALTITHHRTSTSTASDPPYIILSPAGYPRTGPGTPGLMILDRHGDIVWYSPNNGFPASKGEGRLDLKVQIYRGKPVLTWWQGQILRGYGEGRAVIADTSYRTIATIKRGTRAPGRPARVRHQPAEHGAHYRLPAGDDRPVPGGRPGQGGGPVRRGPGDRHPVRPGAVRVEQPGPHPGHRHLRPVRRRDQGRPVRLPARQLDLDRAGRQPADLRSEHQRDLQGGSAQRQGHLAAQREAVQLPDGAGRHLLVPAPRSAAAQAR